MRKKIIFGFVFVMISVFAFIPEVKAQEYSTGDLISQYGFDNSFELNEGDVILNPDSSDGVSRILYKVIVMFDEKEIITYDDLRDESSFVIPSLEDIYDIDIPVHQTQKITAVLSTFSAGYFKVTLSYGVTDDVPKEVVYHNTFEAENNNPFTYYEGETTILLNDISRDGYRFLGWYTSPTFEEDTRVTMISSDAPEVLELYARWEENEEEKENIGNPETRTVLYVGIGIAVVLILGTVLVILYRKRKNHNEEG